MWSIVESPIHSRSRRSAVGCGALRPWVEERLFTGRPRIGEWVDLGTVRGWWDEHQDGRNLNRLFWSLVALESWAARHLDSSREAAPR